MNKLWSNVALLTSVAIIVAPVAISQPINPYVLTAAKIATALGYTPANGASYLALAGGTMTGSIGFSATNTKDIGTNATTLAPRTVYAGTSVVAPIITATTGAAIGVSTGTSLALSSTLNLGSNILFNPSSDGILRLTNNAGTNFDRLQLGGTTSSFPALQRNGASVDFIRADNSDFASVRGFAVTASGGNVSIAGTGQLVVTAMTQTSAAQSGTVCYNSGTGAITYDATLGCLASSERFKTDIVDIYRPDALAITMALAPVSFRKRFEFGGNVDSSYQVGFIAEQVADVDERLIARDLDGSVRGVRYQQMTAILAGAVQELKREINELKTIQK